jgi:myo-inositol 2-dehydrogenase/D-chiro-inositol 1-dehydrogenase
MIKQRSTVYRVGMVGTGYMARRHAEVLVAHPRVECLALCHTPRSAAVAREWQGQYGFRLVSSTYEELLGTPGIDVVWICSPNHLHFEQARLALEAGKHVFCEKPLALSAVQAAHLTRLANSRGRMLAVGMNCRFRKPYIAAKEQATRLGRLLLIRGTYLYNSEQTIREGQKPWWLDVSNHPLLLTSGLLHTLDLMVWFGGEVTTVTTLGSSRALGGVVGEDTLVIGLQFDSGALGELIASFVTVCPNDMTVDVYGEAGSVIANHLIVRSENQFQQTHLDISQPVIDLQLQLENIIGALDGNAALVNNADRAARNLCICESIQNALTSGSAVRVDYEKVKQYYGNSFS